MVHRYPLIKHETVTLPENLPGASPQILQDAALQMIDLFKALLFQVSSGFFTKNPPGAEHGHFLVLFIRGVFHVIRKFLERFGFGLIAPLSSRPQPRNHCACRSGGCPDADDLIPLFRAQVGLDHPVGSIPSTPMVTISFLSFTRCAGKDARHETIPYAPDPPGGDSCQQSSTVLIPVRGPAMVPLIPSRASHAHLAPASMPAVAHAVAGDRQTNKLVERRPTMLSALSSLC